MVCYLNYIETKITEPKNSNMKKILKSRYSGRLYYLKVFASFAILFSVAAVLFYSIFRAMFFEFEFNLAEEATNVLRSVFIADAAAFLVTFIIWIADVARVVSSKRKNVSKQVTPAIPGFAAVAVLLAMIYSFIF